MSRGILTQMFRAAVLCLLVGCSFKVADAPVPPPADSPPVDTPSIDAPVDAAIDAAIDAPSVPVTADFPITQDTYVDSANPVTLFGSTVSMLADGGGQPSVALWRADLAAIPATATIDGVELHIWTSNTLGDPTSIYEMLESWSEASARWADRSTGVAWSGTGAAPPSRGTVAYGTITVTATLTEYVVAVNPVLVAKWTATPAINFGAAIVTTTFNGTAFRTREDTVAGRRPYLRVTYRP